jgi:UDP-glucuronate 4-epimerase
MRILITGSAGFIGFHLARALLEEGCDVLGFDNFNDYYDVSLKEARNAVLQRYAHFELVRGDISDYVAIKSSVERYKPDRVCHLAAQAGVRYSVDHPFIYQESNVKGHLNILEACRHARIDRLVYASSSSVYGGNTKIPFHEKDNVDRPVSLYAATKKACELMSYTYASLYGLQTIGLRFFSVYGPWGRPDMAYWLFAEAMMKNKPIKVFNNGDMHRDFTYIDDIISGIKSALTAKELEVYEIFNLGGGASERLTDFIDLISKFLGVSPKIEMLPMQPGDVYKTYADITLARCKLGYSPEVPLDQGLEHFATWFKSFYTVE